MSAAARVLSDALAPPLAELGVDLEAVEVERAGRRSLVRIVVDRDGGVDLDTVESVSRIVSGLLDEGPLASAVPGPFVLEVTSPGVDRPLKEPRHWRRAAGRLAAIDLADGSSMVARIARADDAQAVVVPEGSDAEVALPLDAVSRAVVQVEFTRED